MVIVVSIYYFAWAGVDHRDYPGLVLTCVCDGTRTRLGSGYPKRLGSIFQTRHYARYG